jgi:hypothetical protein
MRWLALSVVILVMLFACGREMIEEEIPLYAAVYGTVRSSIGTPVENAQLKAIAFVEGCSGATVGVGYAATDSLGHYRVRVLSLGGVQNPACVGISAIGSRPTDSVAVTVPSVSFLRGVDVGREDSVRVDIRIP